MGDISPISQPSLPPSTGPSSLDSTQPAAPFSLSSNFASQNPNVMNGLNAIAQCMNVFACSLPATTGTLGQHVANYAMSVLTQLQSSSVTPQTVAQIATTLGGYASDIGYTLNVTGQAGGSWLTLGNELTTLGQAITNSLSNPNRQWSLVFNQFGTAITNMINPSQNGLVSLSEQQTASINSWLNQPEFWV